MIGIENSSDPSPAIPLIGGLLFIAYAVFVQRSGVTGLWFWRRLRGQPDDDPRSGWYYQGTWIAAGVAGVLAIVAGCVQIFGS
jgi:hypothetical protein